MPCCLGLGIQSDSKVLWCCKYLGLRCSPQKDRSRKRWLKLKLRSKGRICKSARCLLLIIVRTTTAFPHYLFRLSMLHYVWSLPTRRCSSSIREKKGSAAQQLSETTRLRSAVSPRNLHTTKRSSVLPSRHHLHNYINVTSFSFFFL